MSMSSYEKKSGTQKYIQYYFVVLVAFIKKMVFSNDFSMFFI